MSEIKIDREIPIPPRHRPGGSNAKYPWPQMEVGDSFFVAEKLRKITGSAQQAGARMKRKFSLRTVTENGVKGTRVWRVA